jgi:hypothetical protein
MPPVRPNHIRPLIQILSLMLFFYNTAMAQQPLCKNKYDSVSVVKYVQQKGLLLLPEGYTLEEISKYPSMAPSVSFDKNKCRWSVTSSTSKHSMKGNCKNTNGCTVVTVQTVALAANNGKIISTKRRFKKYHNYE